MINRSAGTGQGGSVVQSLSSVFTQELGGLAEVKVELVSDHAEARARAARFISESEAPALIVAGGGGGTLRAVIEGIYDTHATERVRVGALRMGSGNLVAKQFGVPHDPVLALQGLLLNLKAGRTVPCCVMRCETWTSSGMSEVHHGVSLGGLGQFGRIPSDLVPWRARLSVFHRYVARLFGLERVNNSEYALAFLIRYISCVLFPILAETVEVRGQRFRLLAGVVMNFPIAALPFKPGVTVRDEFLSIYMIPLSGHTRIIRIGKDQPLDIRFVDRDQVEFFLDEDPVTTCKQLRLSVAGSIAFVPGPDYRGVSA
ncbi:MAG TPA: diacylglycerol kinase family protein [Pyrinomonadaceae bacterium]|nr:diacylglycerol kinase family protein [Pyrinomonadaceae bacterium]